MVGDLVALGLEEGDEVDEQLVCRVVAADVDAHLRRSVSKIGPTVRERLSSKKPSVPATRTQPSQSRPAASPFGAGLTTGPKKATPLTATTGVPTSSPTRSIARWWLARSASSCSSLVAASASSAGRPEVLERAGDRDGVVLAAVVDALAERVVERLDDLVAELARARR